MIEIYSFVSGQGYILAVMFLLGGMLGLLYDVIRVFRRLFFANRLAVDITDALYWLVVTACIWYAQNEVAEGEIRFCQLLAVALGMILYYIVLSPTAIRLFYMPLHFAGKQLHRFYRYVCKRVDAACRYAVGKIQKIRKRNAYEEAKRQEKEK